MRIRERTRAGDGRSVPLRAPLLAQFGTDRRRGQCGEPPTYAPGGGRVRDTQPLGEFAQRDPVWDREAVRLGSGCRGVALLLGEPGAGAAVAAERVVDLPQFERCPRLRAGPVALRAVDPVGEPQPERSVVSLAVTPEDDALGLGDHPAEAVRLGRPRHPERRLAVDLVHLVDDPHVLDERGLPERRLDGRGVPGSAQKYGTVVVRIGTIGSSRTVTTGRTSRSRPSGTASAGTETLATTLTTGSSPSRHPARLPLPVTDPSPYPPTGRTKPVKRGWRTVEGVQISRGGRRPSVATAGGYRVPTGAVAGRRRPADRRSPPGD